VLNHYAHSSETSFKDLRVLDIGCGAGLLSESLGRLGFAKVTGIDPTPRCIEMATNHLELQKISDPELLKTVEYRNTTVEDLIGKEELFDLVCCSEVIEHVHDQPTFLKNCLSMVKPDTGLFFLSSISKTWEGYVSNILVGEHVLGLLPKGTHEYDLLITPEEVEKIISNPCLM
jgi:2-polyprenyl-6-hydroxyphenyl methylase / 3-demethylubiquinone-9 3-methyltransferase